MGIPKTFAISFNEMIQSTDITLLPYAYVIPTLNYTTIYAYVYHTLIYFNSLRNYRIFKPNVSDSHYL